jgi:hypothetical protein
MAVELTEKEFSQHLHSKFQLEVGGENLELELIEVKGYLPQANEQAGMERFSIFFDGPGGTRLPQNVYSLTHNQMGQFDIFLVPISGDRKGFRYEAVFNYFKSEPPAVAGGP